MRGMLRTYGDNFTLVEWGAAARASAWQSLKGGKCLTHQSESRSAWKFEWISVGSASKARV